MGLGGGRTRESGFGFSDEFPDERFDELSDELSDHDGDAEKNEQGE